MSALEIALLVALVLAGLRIGYGRGVELRTPIALMLGTALGSGLDWLDVAVTPAIAMTADIVIICVIMAAKTTPWEKAIIVLFFVAWPFYFFGGTLTTPVTTVITIVQFLLTIPLRPLWQRAARATRRMTEKDDFDLCVAEVRDGR